MALAQTEQRVDFTVRTPSPPSLVTQLIHLGLNPFRGAILPATLTKA